MNNKTTPKLHSVKKALIILIATLFTGLIAFSGIVFVFDPFCQYHAPIFGDDTPLFDSYNQVGGSLKNFDYDSLIVGNSLVQNCNTDCLENEYALKLLSATKQSGTMYDLVELSDISAKHREIKEIFWCLDYSQFEGATEVTLYSADNAYLYTDTILDDAEYLFNKEIVFKTIPLMIYNYKKGINVGGNAYDWSEGKNFNKEQAMSYYTRPEITLSEIIDLTDEYDYDTAIKNLEHLCEFIEAHPEIKFTFFCPPVSMNWWDSGYINGLHTARLIVWEQAFLRLTAYENVNVYCYQTERAIVCDLDNYMDFTHYSPKINQWMLDSVIAGERSVTADNYTDYLKEMDELTLYIEYELYGLK